MRIALDARAWNWTGIGRYIRNLTAEYLKHSGGHSFTLLVPKGEEEKIREELEGGVDPRIRGDDDGRREVTFEYVGVEPSYYSLKEQTVFLRQLNALKNIDLVHFAHFNVPIFYNKPFVVTIHDITRFIFPGQKRQSLLQQIGYEYVFAHAVRSAKKVIAVSNTTARDMRLLPFRARSTEVIYEGLEDRFFQPISASQKNSVRAYIKIKTPYIVFVGVWMSHKNIFRLIDAFALVHKNHPDLSLVITGKYQDGYSDLLRYVGEKGLAPQVIFPGFVPDELLPALYAESAGMAFPSLYEGYGLPPLEAQACGAPVIASNVSSMPELLRDSVEYVNPESIGDIARGIKKVVNDDAYAQKVRTAGLRNVERYSTVRMAKEHIRVYENALQ